LSSSSVLPPSPGLGRGTRREGHARIGVLASGAGSNLQAMLDACARGEIEGEVVVVVSHREGAGALERARRAGIPAIALPLQDRRDRAVRRQHEEHLLDLLRQFELDLVVLAGWMLILSAQFLSQCPWPLVNIHPALLPMDDSDALEIPILRGAHAVRDALALHLPFTGVSIHHVTPQVDAGPVVLREIVPIDWEDDEESLYCRIKAVEHRLLPQAVHIVLSSHTVGGVHA
jgi:phosphoribosylglycinamide formyltransferase 1